MDLGYRLKGQAERLGLRISAAAEKSRVQLKIEGPDPGRFSTMERNKTAINLGLIIKYHGQNPLKSRLLPPPPRQRRAGLLFYGGI